MHVLNHLQRPVHAVVDPSTSFDLPASSDLNDAADPSLDLHASSDLRADVDPSSSSDLHVALCQI